MLLPHPLPFQSTSEFLFLSLVSCLPTNVQMIGFVSNEKREPYFTRWRPTEHMTRATKRKQSMLIFAVCPFPPHLWPAFFVYPSFSLQQLQLFQRNKPIVIFFLSINNGLSILICPTIKSINFIKLSERHFQAQQEGDVRLTVPTQCIHC